MTAATPLPLRPPFRFTRHAVDRYIERVHAGRCGDARALQELVAASHGAELLDRPSWHGNHVWSIREPAMRWIATIEDGSAVVLTIIAGADEGVEAERIEYDAVRVRRLLDRIPQIGRGEATSPAPRGEEDFRSWVGLESRRLEVERKRLGALRDALLTPRERMARRREELNERREGREAGQSIALAEADRAIKRRNNLLKAMAERLAEVDPAGSADVLETWRRLREPPGPAR
jgi:hypothetical protein